ncbi:hypothetical protein LTR66_004101 [Elasticomyces elasticus]|nr:hypothetical protein LTR66_004101 [Elasticomyces elasticus]
MGASDSKLVFKQGIFRLSEQQSIPADDTYWTGFWELPESTEDVFSLFSSTDIRRTRDNSITNLETLILAVTSRLVVLRNNPSFPDPELAPERDALNCIRVLTRLLPYVYETDHLEAWEERFFWGARKRRNKKAQASKHEVLFDGSDPEHTPTAEMPDFEDTKPLGEELIDTLVDLLFFPDFTLPKAQKGRGKVTYAIWQSGVGCNTPIGTSRELENNRTEILRLLLTLAGKSMYMVPSMAFRYLNMEKTSNRRSDVLPSKGVQAITYIVTCPDKQIVLSLLCSLLNTTLKYNPASWRVPYDHVVFKDPRQTLVTYCLQLLLVLVVYPIPDDSKNVISKNYFRHFLGRLHRPQDFQFLVDGMTRILNQPLQATSSYLPGSQKSLTWAPEMIALFWEALQCNKRFRSFIIDTERAHDFMVLVLFYATDSRSDPSKQGIVRMCVFVLQTMSVEANFGKSLNKVFEGQETLPTSIRIPNFHGSYADYLITSIHTLITASSGKLEAIYPALLAIINNIAAHVENLGRATSSKLLQLFVLLSSPTFLLANESNHALLQSLLEAMNAIIEHQYSRNPAFVWAVLRAQKRFQALRDFTLEGAQDEIERQTQLRKEQSGEQHSLRSPRRSASVDSLRSPASLRSPSLSNVPENSAFAIGEDEDVSDDDNTVHQAPSRSSTQSGTTSRAASVSSNLDDAVPQQVRGMSEKARGKMPMGQPQFPRQSNSTTSLNSLGTTTLTSNNSFVPTVQWIESWLPELSLHTILTLIPQLNAQVSTDTAVLASSSNRAPTRSTPGTPEITTLISSAKVSGIDPSPIRVHLFEWSALSLGWYASLLWGFIFASEIANSRGTNGVWNGTNVKLFHVQEVGVQGPTLLAPRGAVDAVGSNLVQRIGSLGIRARDGVRGVAGEAPTAGVSVREV